MLRSQSVLVAVLIGIAASAAAGDVWINCAPEVDIFLDGESAGVFESDVGGMHLRGIEPGAHSIRIEKNGIALAEFSVNVGFDPIQVEVGELAAGMSEQSPGASQETADRMLVGTIEITSDPEECNVKIGSRRILKKYPIMTIPGIPVGEHKLWFESAGKVLSQMVVVQGGQAAKVVVDFPNQQVAIGGDDLDVESGDSVADTKIPRAEPGCIEYWIEVLRTNDPEAIEPYQQMLKELGFPREHQTVITIEEGDADPVFKLRVGPVPRSKKAKWAAGIIRNAGVPTVWVVPEECQPSSGSAPKREFKPRISGG